MESVILRGINSQKTSAKNSLVSRSSSRVSQGKRIDFVGLKQQFDQSNKLSAESWLVLASSLEYLAADAGTKLQYHGTCSDYVYFLSDGVAREYSINSNRTEVNRAFYQPYAIVGSLNSYTQSTPNTSFVELVTAGSFYRIKCEKLATLMEQYSDIRYWYPIVMSRTCLQMQNRLTDLLSKNESQRLKDFVTESPELIRNVPAKYLSSYLGIPSVIINIVKKNVAKPLVNPNTAKSILTA